MEPDKFYKSTFILAFNNEQSNTAQIRASSYFILTNDLMLESVWSKKLITT